MNNMARFCWLAIILSFMLSPAGTAWAQSDSEKQEREESAPLVGRIYYVEGELLRYVEEEEDWVATVADAPFGLQDALYSDENGKAEFMMPNETWVRIDASTQIQLLTLRDDLTEIDVASGTARFFNKGSNTEIKVTTPFGFVSAAEGTVFDMYVGEGSVEVIALVGTVDFVLNATSERYEASAGSPSILADKEQVTDGEGFVNSDWDEWNKQRDAVWTERVQVKGDSIHYLPSALHRDAYDLERHGRWERVEYEGEYRTFWRPVHVHAEWQPFTVGRWTTWYGDNCWVPDEPFGYVTHHYGNWVYASNYWYWAPPVVRVGVAVGPPLLGIGFGWYPGRVAWIHSGIHVGWIPLAPFEPYYSHRYWGRRSIIVTNVNAVRININSYRYFNRAVIINQRNFYSVRNYNSVRVTNINRNLISTRYHGAPVINNRVIRDYDRNRNRFKFTNAEVRHKPDRSVVNRINHNRQITKRDEHLRGKTVRDDVRNLNSGKPVKGAKIGAPKVKSKLDTGRQVHRSEPKQKVKEGALKGRLRPPLHEPRVRAGEPKAGKEGGTRPPAPKTHLRPGESERRLKERQDRTKSGEDRNLKQRNQDQRLPRTQDRKVKKSEQNLRQQTQDLQVEDRKQRSQKKSDQQLRQHQQDQRLQDTRQRGQSKRGQDLQQRTRDQRTKTDQQMQKRQLQPKQQQQLQPKHQGKQSQGAKQGKGKKQKLQLE
jgi:hypothetical protein